MLRREMIVGLLGTLAVPLSRLFGLKTKRESMNDSNERHYHTEIATHLDDDRVVYRKTPEGLYQISWDRIKLGDNVVIFDWVDGHIVSVMDCGKARGLHMGPNDLIDFDLDDVGYGFTNCVKI